MIKTDCDGNILAIGDRVAVQNKNYKELQVSIIEGFTPQKLIVVEMGRVLKYKRHVDPRRVAKVLRQC